MWEAIARRLYSSGASQYEKRKLGRTYVAVKGDDLKVLGYYTIASSALAFTELPLELARKLPKHPIPVILLGRLAVDQTMQGQRLGEKLLIEALKKALELSQFLGVQAVEVDAIDAEASGSTNDTGSFPYQLKFSTYISPSTRYDFCSILRNDEARSIDPTASAVRRSCASRFQIHHCVKLRNCPQAAPVAAAAQDRAATERTPPGASARRRSTCTAWPTAPSSQRTAADHNRHTGPLGLLI